MGSQFPLWIHHRCLMYSPTISYGSPLNSYGIPMDPLWIYYGLLIHPLWLSQWHPLWFTIDVLWIIQRCDMDPLRILVGYGCQWHPLWIQHRCLMDSPTISYGSSLNSCACECHTGSWLIFYGFPTLSPMDSPSMSCGIPDDSYGCLLISYESPMDSYRASSLWVSNGIS